MTREKIQQKQVNIRLDDETLNRIDSCRTYLLESHGGIPTRSDVVRMAITAFLEECEKKAGSGKK